MVFCPVKNNATRRGGYPTKLTSGRDTSEREDCQNWDQPYRLRRQETRHSHPQLSVNTLRGFCLTD